MPSFRHKRSPKLSRNPTLAFKLLAAILVLTFYFILTLFRTPSDGLQNKSAPHPGEKIQWDGFADGLGATDREKAQSVMDAMKHTFWQYKNNAWGHDDILPVSGGFENSRNGWGAFIVDAASTLSIMGLWEELSLAVDYIVHTIDFSHAQDLVDPFETTIRYLGGLVSLVDLADAGIIPSHIISEVEREAIIQKAVILAQKLGPGYDTPTGMPWPRVDFDTNKGVLDPPEIYKKRPELKRYEHPIIGPARSGSNILENRVLSRLTGDPIFTYNATRSWSHLVWSNYVPPVPGMVNAPLDIVTGAPVERQWHWDAGHDSYYEYLIKMAIMAPDDRYSPVYVERWKEAATSLHMHLASRSSPSEKEPIQHLFIGKQNGEYYINSQSHLACFAGGNLLLGGAYLKNQTMISFGQALVEGCRHSYNATATGIGPEVWSWMPKFGRLNPPTENATYMPRSPRQETEFAEHGLWIEDAKYRLRPEYIESLFYAWRITGQPRYRHWAWEAFLAIEKHCKTDFGYAALRDVMYDGNATKVDKPLRSDKTKETDDDDDDDDVKEGNNKQLDEAESFWAAETLKYFWLLFTDVETVSLDRWVFSTEGHLFRMIRK